jgi:uncharacterized protein involved in outer membrane biogenesis
MTRTLISRWWWVAALVLPLAVLLLLFRWDWLIPLAEARASAALGRPVTIQHLLVRLGRVVTLRVEGLHIANPAGFEPDPPLALGPRLDMEVALRPLLHGHLVLPGVALEQPALALRQGADGKANFRFDLPAGGGGESPAIGRIMAMAMAR